MNTISIQAILGLAMTSVALISCAEGNEPEHLPEPLNLGAMIQPIGNYAFYSEPGYATWDGNLFKEGDSYYLVYSRWKSRGGDWLTTSEVCLAESADLKGPYKHVKVILKGRGKGHWDELMGHNPKLKKFGGKYYLYYISTQAGASRNKTRNNQRTGVAVSDSLLGSYIPSDKPIVEPKPPVYTLTVNPGVAKGPNGRYVMILKGDKKPTQGQRVQGIALADSPTGPFEIQPKLAIDGFDTEDASLWYDKERKAFFAIYHAHSHVGLITSADGINWKHAKHSKIMGKAIAQTNGKIKKLLNVERPYVFFENGKPAALCISTRRGRSYNTGHCLVIPLGEEN